MPDLIELTAEQLATLDQIISQKQKGEKIITNINIEGCAITLVVCEVTPVVTAVAEVAGATVIKSSNDFMNSPLIDIISNISIEKLIELRKKAIQKS